MEKISFPDDFIYKFVENNPLNYTSNVKDSNHQAPIKCRICTGKCVCENSSKCLCGFKANGNSESQIVKKLKNHIKFVQKFYLEEQKGKSEKNDQENQKKANKENWKIKIAVVGCSHGTKKLI